MHRVHQIIETHWARVKIIYLHVNRSRKIIFYFQKQAGSVVVSICGHEIEQMDS